MTDRALKHKPGCGWLKAGEAYQRFFEGKGPEPSHPPDEVECCDCGATDALASPETEVDA